MSMKRERRLIRMRVTRGGSLGCVVLALTVGAPLSPASPQELRRINLDSSGNEGNDDSFGDSLSDDGRYVAFSSDANNLIPGDTNPWEDVFVYDRKDGSISRVSVSSSGAEGRGPSHIGMLSGDGNLVAFSSGAENLVVGDTNFESDVFVHDRSTGLTTRVSVRSNGDQGTGASTWPTISKDGRYVAFYSGAPNLVSRDRNSRWDVFLHDRETGETTRVSVSSRGDEGNGDSYEPSLSADGRFVAFTSRADNLVPRDTNRHQDVFLHEIATGLTTRLSVTAAGDGGNFDSWSCELSDDGQVALFVSLAGNLVAGDSNHEEDIFVRDVRSSTTVRVSVSSSGDQGDLASHYGHLSSDGTRVSFQSSATNLVPGDTNQVPDGFVHVMATRETTRVTVSQNGTEGGDRSGAARFSSDDRFLCFSSKASNLVGGDNNDSWDVFLDGPDVTLETSATSAPPGSQISLSIWGGLPFGPTLLIATEVNGLPLQQKITAGQFDATGEWILAGTVPPSLAGFEVTFAGVGLNPSNEPELSNEVTVTF